MCAENGVLAFIYYIIMIKKLNGFNYEQKTVPFAVHKMQSRKTENTQMASSVGTVKDVIIHMSGRTKPINTKESSYGLRNGYSKDIRLPIYAA